MKPATDRPGARAGAAPVLRIDAVVAADHLIDAMAASALHDDPLVDDGVGGGLLRLVMEWRRQTHGVRHADEGATTTDTGNQERDLGSRILGCPAPAAVTAAP